MYITKYNIKYININIINSNIYKVRDKNERMLQEAKALHEDYQKRIKLMCYSFDIMLSIFIFICIILSLSSLSPSHQHYKLDYKLGIVTFLNSTLHPKHLL